MSIRKQSLLLLIISRSLISLSLESLHVENHIGNVYLMVVAIDKVEPCLIR